MTEDERVRVLQAVEQDIELVKISSVNSAAHTLWIDGKPYLVSVERSTLWPRT